MNNLFNLAIIGAEASSSIRRGHLDIEAGEICQMLYHDFVDHSSSDLRSGHSGRLRFRVHNGGLLF